jgi:hypothetical protein
MRNVRCNCCGNDFSFSPTADLTSLGLMFDSQSVVARSEVVLCPLCRRWTQVQLTDADRNTGSGVCAISKHSAQVLAAGDKSIETWPSVHGYACRKCGDVARWNPNRPREWGCAQCNASTRSVGIRFDISDEALIGIELSPEIKHRLAELAAILATSGAAAPARGQSETNCGGRWSSRRRVRGSGR